jgi:CheY-like chemotaxis protein
MNMQVRAMTKTPTILTISSDRMVRFLTEELEAQGYRVKSATSVVSSLVAYHNTAPDLILIMEHFIEGAPEAIVLCRHLRDVAGSDLPMVFISTMGYRDAIEELGIAWFDLLEMQQALDHIVKLLPPSPDAGETFVWRS